MKNLSRNILFFALLFSLESFAQKNLKEIIENLDRASFSLVAYNAEGKEIKRASGFFIAANGLALGRAHVFQNAVKLEAFSEEKTPMNVQLLHAFEPMGDLALFTVNTGGQEISFISPQFESPSVDEEVIVLDNVSESKSKPDLGKIIRVEGIGGFGEMAELQQKIKEENNGAAVLNRDGELIGVANTTAGKSIMLNWNGLSETNAILQNYEGGKLMPAHVIKRFDNYAVYNKVYDNILKGFYTAALNDLNKVLAIEVNDIGGIRHKQSKLFLKAYLENKSDEPEKALESYTQILEEDIGNQRAYLERAQIKIENGDLKSAAMDLDESAQYGEESAEVSKAKADIFTQLDDLEEAKKFYAKAEEFGYKGYEIHKEKARMYFKMNELVEAKMEIEKALLGNPYDADLYTLNGKIQAKLGNTEEALASLKKSSEYGVSESNVLIEQAEAYILARDYDQAIHILQEVLKVDSNNLRGIFVRGVAFNKIQNYKRSRDDFNYVLKKDPYNSEAYYERGKAFIALAEYPEAIQDFTKCINLKPTFDGAYIDRGVTYGIVNQFPEALNDFEMALQINPKSPEATFNKALALYQMKRYEEACVTFEKAVQLGHDDAAARAEDACKISSQTDFMQQEIK